MDAALVLGGLVVVGGGAVVDSSSAGFAVDGLFVVGSACST